MKEILSLFITFLKIGAFTFGGGYAMIPLIQHEMVEKKKWLTNEEMVDIIAIAESTPGVLAVNTATFVGYKIGKFWGSFFATLGVILPSMIIITIISVFFEDFLKYEYVIYAFKGIRACVAALILHAALRIAKHFPKTAFSYILVVVALVASIILQIRTTYIILFGLAIGIVSQMIVAKIKQNKPKAEEKL
ncbi:MAG: chromate transporter [Bacilli bacterium]|jgi:chromate transporter|nr:chromate transporter [Bacilli bacterium]